MNNEREEILNELKQIAPTLAGLERKDALVVPQDYFLGVQSRVFDAIAAESATEDLKAFAPVLAALPKLQERSVPVDYFNSLSANVLGKIRVSEVAAELESIAPALATVPKAKEALPPAYFTQLQANVFGQIKQAEKPAKASVFQSINAWVDRVLQPLFSPQYSFAFASVLTVVVVSWFAVAQINKPVTESVNVTAAIEKVSRNEVQAYIAANMDEFDYSMMARNAAEVRNTLQIDDNVANDAAILKDLMNEMSEDELFASVES